MSNDLSRIAIVIPAYNPPYTLITLIQQLHEKKLTTIVLVNDGSEQRFEHIFNALKTHSIFFLEHSKNMGKGAALKTAFAFCISHLPDLIGVVTADADGQHLPADIALVAHNLLENPTQFILGTRTIHQHVPLRSRIGNIATRHVFAFVTGNKILDTQTGLRGIPKTLLQGLISLNCSGYEYEMNVLLSLKQHNVLIQQIPINTVYLENNKSSHFNPLKDSFKIYFQIIKFWTTMKLSSIYTGFLSYTSLTLCVVSMLCLKLVPINSRSKFRIQILLYDFFSFLKAKLLHKEKRSARDYTLLKDYIRYITRYLIHREFSRNTNTIIKSNKLLHYTLSFSTYESMFAMFNEIFGHEVYAFTADNKAPCIIDCGSNIGLSILYFKAIYPQARIIGFEPGPETFTLLQKNVLENKLNNVTIHNKAVHNTEASLKFYVSSHNIAHGGWSIKGSEHHNHEAHSQMVQATKLSSYVTEPVDLLKIDIEGAEIMVLDELAESGKLSMIKQIILEYHHHMADPTQDCLARILKHFEDHNFGYQFNSVEKAVPEKKNRNVLVLYVYNKSFISLQQSIQAPLQRPTNPETALRSTQI